MKSQTGYQWKIDFTSDYNAGNLAEHLASSCPLRTVECQLCGMHLAAGGRYYVVSEERAGGEGLFAHLARWPAGLPADHQFQLGGTNIISISCF